MNAPDMTSKGPINNVYTVRDFFIYDTDHPKSLNASVISAETSSLTYLVTCPTSCASSDFPEQTITHISGSSWAGEHVAGGSRTVWGCDLGKGDNDPDDLFGWCEASTVDEDAKRPEMGKTQTGVDECWVASRPVPVYVNAGGDEEYWSLYPYLPEAPTDADELLILRTQALSSMGCEETITAKMDITRTRSGDGWATITASESEGDDEDGEEDAATSVTLSSWSVMLLCASTVLASLLAM